ncbi:MAG TPA: hypothetical protein VMS73_04950 [Anaerolineaceae bacterium]|nr:hypothetical protein [Anaerolineaceae bacterium]
MIRNEERMRVLKMVADGKITAEQATSLLEALDDGPAAAGRAQSIPGATAASQVGRYFRVRVTDKITGRVRVNVRLPVGVINAGLKLGMRFAPQVEGIDYQEVAELIRSGGVGKIVDVEDEEDSERVEIYIE